MTTDRTAPRGLFGPTLWLCALCLTFPAGAADNPDPQDLAREIRMLSSNRVAERRAAEQQLLNWGRQILPHLPPAESADSPAAQQAIRRVRQTLELSQARHALEPTLISVSMNRSERVAGAQLAETVQTTAGLGLLGLPEFITLPATTPLPCWDVIHEVSRATSSGWRLEESPAALRFDPASAPLPMATANPAAFAVRMLSQEVRTVDELHLFRVTLGLVAEPRLRVLLMNYAARDFQVVLEDREPLPLWNPDARIEQLAGRGQGERTMSLDFTLAAPAAPQRYTLLGRVQCLVATGTEPLEFPDWRSSSVPSRRRGAVAVRVVQAAVNRADHTADVEVVVTYETELPTFESHQQGVFYQAAWLESPEGKRFPQVRCELSDVAPSGARLTYFFAKLPANDADLRFVVAPAAALIQTPVTFRLDVPDRNRLAPR